jgi:hypothetical protein
VTAADLQARGIDTSRLPSVQICRWDDDALMWHPLATTQDGGEFVAQAPQPGQYMPALTWQALDSQGPGLDAITRYDATTGAQVAFWDGAKVRRGFAGGVTVTVSDRPAGMNLGLNPGSVLAKVDGNAVAAEVASAGSGQFLVRLAPAASLALGEHALTLEAADTAGYRSTLGPWKFTVLPASDVNEDGKVDDEDLIRFRQAWLDAHKSQPAVDHSCDLAPAEGSGDAAVIRPDGAIGAEDAKAFLELWMRERQ